MEEKGAKKNKGEGIEDRLSTLPDSILLHILSFLPTKSCVNTMSLVSHRYRNLWEHLQVLNVDDNDFLDISENELFRYISLFVNSFLARRKSRNIQKFRLNLCCNFFFDDFFTLYIETWIRTAIGPYLEELHLALFSNDDGAFYFPLNILSSCPNLLSLSLYGNILLQTQLLRSSMVCLPSLKKLELDLLDDVDVFDVDILFSGCPVVETLEASLSTKSLARLSVPHSLKSLRFIAENGCGTCLEIDTPDLKYLHLTGISFEANSIGNLRKVDKAYLDVFSMPNERLCASVDPLHNLFQALSGIKRLVLDCCSTTKWFDVEFPEFQHLIYLELILPCFNIGFLYHVLQKCHMLQTLKIKKGKHLLPPLYGLAPKPKTVPICLVSHLTFIHFIGCEGYSDEVKFTMYVLRKGLVLKTMHVSSLSQEKWEKDDILTKFSNTPKGSVSCQLQFD